MRKHPSCQRHSPLTRSTRRVEPDRKREPPRIRVSTPCGDLRYGVHRCPSRGRGHGPARRLLLLRPRNQGTRPWTRCSRRRIHALVAFHAPVPVRRRRNVSVTKWDQGNGRSHVPRALAGSVFPSSAFLFFIILLLSLRTDLGTTRTYKALSVDMLLSLLVSRLMRRVIGHQGGPPTGVTPFSGGASPVRLIRTYISNLYVVSRGGGGRLVAPLFGAIPWPGDHWVIIGESVWLWTGR